MKPILLLFVTLVSVLNLHGQDSTSDKQVLPISRAYLTTVQKKAADINKKLDRKTADLISHFNKNEERIRKKLSVIDSSAAKTLFDRASDPFQLIQQGKAGRWLRTPANSYLDTLQSSLAFLEGSQKYLGQVKDLKSKMGSAIGQVQQLSDKLKQAESIKAYIRERRELLTQQLSQFSGFGKNLQKMNKQAYYYAEQVKAYKEVLKDRKKIEQTAMSVIRKMPAFNNYIQKYSRFAGLLSLQSGDNTVASLEGLQTRNQVEQLIQQRMGGGGPNAQAALSQQMDAARSRFEELKNKFPGADDAAEMPNFKPNEMKTKSFLQRLEFGGNVQFQRSNNFYPTTSDIAGQVAYKLHKNGSVGMGVSYILGMGTGFNNVRFNSQGVGLRSFLDWKLKNTFYVNGGFEKNYNNDFLIRPPGTTLSNWQESALIGLSKKYKINTKLKGNILLLYDFLYHQHIPYTSPLKVRMGYNF